MKRTLATPMARRGPAPSTAAFKSARSGPARLTQIQPAERACPVDEHHFCRVTVGKVAVAGWSRPVVASPDCTPSRPAPPVGARRLRERAFRGGVGRGHGVRSRDTRSRGAVMANATITFRVEETERDELVSRAAREKVNLSDYIRVRLGLRSQGSQGDLDVEIGSQLELALQERIADHERRLQALEAEDVARRA